MVVARNHWDGGQFLLLRAMRMSLGLAKSWSLLKFSGRSAKFLFTSRKVRFCWRDLVFFILSLKITLNRRMLFHMKHLFPGQGKHFNSFLSLARYQPFQNQWCCGAWWCHGAGAGGDWSGPAWLYRTWQQVCDCALRQQARVGKENPTFLLRPSARR